ncbi:hypothetical protein A3862_29510 [Methylobacterium sp. XJLW]|jgi:hypothetical protein|uniref:Protein of unassigned function n=1 Tax=Methylobacterium oryzae CBMB20 TaxID=693986 RepID=A0A089NLB2_9HYPH|nr:MULTISPECIES: hypothetical protein [Methylobacterium]AIQ88157.1 protein of unassigned function [Methylobacterium oryzae CBMB20]AWV19172.1 hypothetical protein A3862_29510 [Methylobacterium sp. XJLW]
MALFAPVRSETTDLDAVRRYAVRVIAQSEAEDLQMKAVTLALLGGIMWRAAPGSTEMMQDAASAKAILSTTLGGRNLTFAYDQNTESIEMREGTTDGPVLHRFCNRTLIGDFERTFSALWG